MGWDLPGSGKKLAPRLRAAPKHGGDRLQSGLDLRGRAGLCGKATSCFVLEGCVSEEQRLREVAVPRLLYES